MKIRFSSQKRQPSDVSQGMKVPYAPGRRGVFQWRWYLILAAVASPFAYLIFTMLYPLVVVTAPGFISLEKQTITASSTGVVDRISVRVGDRVEEGQLLLQLADPKLEQRIQAVRSSLANFDTASLPSGTGTGRLLPHELELYREQLNHAERAATRHQQRLAVVRQLFSQGAATVAEVNAVQVQLDGVEHTLIQARLDLNAASTKYMSGLGEQIEPDQERKALEEQLEQLQRQQQQLTLRALRAGTILDLPVDKGKVVAPGEPLALLGTRDRPYIVAYLQPEAVTIAEPGRGATVSIPGGPSVEARVRTLPTQARRLPADFSSVIGTRDIMVLVILDFLEPLPVERSVEGLPVDVRFHRF